MRSSFHSLLVLVSLLLTACDSGNPVAPQQPVAPVTNAPVTVTLSASPSSVAAGSGMPSTITMTVVQADGQPPADGTLANLSTDIGHFGPDGDGNLQTAVSIGLVGGVGQASLFPADEVGTAMVLGQLGSSVSALEVAFFEPTQDTVFLVAVDPATGDPDGGQPVVVTGGGFRQPLRVQFGAGLGQVVSASETRIEVITPAALMPVPTGQSLAVDVTVTTSLDQPESSSTATLPSGFTYVDGTAPLFIVAVEPNRGSAEGGDTVTVHGGGFRAPLRVDFGGKPGELPAVGADGTAITVVVPAASQPVPAGDGLLVDVTVTNALDQPEPATATLAGGYTYFDGTAPLFIVSVEPNRGQPEGGETVTVRGGGFRAPLRVDFGGKPGEMAEVSADGSAITVVVPDAPLPVPAGEELVVDVTVTNALDQPTPSSTTLAGGYTYAAAAEDQPPQVASITPESGPNEGGTVVTILGSNFADPAVFFGQTEATAVTLESATRITATTPPAGAANQDLTVDVTVRNRATGLEGTLPMAFTYGPAPIVVTDIEPTSGSYEGGTEVTVTGQGFPTTGTVAVEVAGIRQTGEVVDSETMLRFTTVGIALAECPASGQIPQMGVTVTDVATGNAGSANLTFTYIVPMPTIQRVSPTVGPQLGNTLVNIEGTGTATAAFEDPVQVVFAQDGQEFAAVVQSRTETLVRVSSPRVPDSLFPEVDCLFDDGSEDGAPGKRYVAATVDVRVTNVATGCADTFGNAFTYSPTNPNCRQVGQEP